MILLLDVKRQLVHVYKKDGHQEISFEDIDELPYVMGNNTAVYVTAGTNVKSQQVMDLVKGFMPEEKPFMPSEFYAGKDASTYFLRSTAPGPVVFGKMQFLSPGDCKEIDEDLRQQIMSSEIVQGLIKNNKLQIITSQEMRRIVKKYTCEHAAKQAQKQKLKDHELDKIIVDGRAEDIAADPMSYLSDAPDGSDSEIIDLSDNRPTADLSGVDLSAFEK